jgi:hypothetical protein
MSLVESVNKSVDLSLVVFKRGKGDGYWGFVWLELEK